MRLIDADVLVKNLTGMKDFYDAITLDGMIKALKTAPTADAVEVVRCKNCKHLMFSDFYGECSKGHMSIVSPDDFCSYGERKDGE